MATILPMMKWALHILLSIFCIAKPSAYFLDIVVVISGDFDLDDLVIILIQTLTMACQALGFKFLKLMMMCSIGSCMCDGPWGTLWYDDVHQSSEWAHFPGSIVL